jgi:hypothetical protein
MTSINFYKITSANTDKVYVGSTDKDINARLNQHERDYKRYQDGKYHNVTSFEILECKDYKIELLENKICESKEQRDTVECNYIINTPNTVNRNLPGRIPEQYRQDNKEELNEQYRQYYQENKEEIQRKKNEKHNCFCGGKYTKVNKAIHEKTQKHQTFIRNQQPINNYGVINIYNAPNQ